MKCSDCGEKTEGRKDNRGKVRCTACWAEIPAEVVEAAKAEAEKASAKPVVKSAPKPSAPTRKKSK